MHHQLRTIISLAALLLLCGSPLIIRSANAGVVPGRMLNSNHEEIFAQQAKEIQRNRAKERKPFLACPSGLIPCLSQADADPRDDVYECVEIASSLQSCGGCSLRRNEDGDVEHGDGEDCTAIPNVLGVECYSSQCVITSCKAGYQQSGEGCD